MKNLLKGICLVVALMATFAMVGCGGGGGGKSHSTAPVVNPSLDVSIPTSALGGGAGAGTNLRASVRASATFDDLLRLTVQYLDDNGTLQDAENEARKLTKNGENYKCNDISLLPGRDYRFKVFLQNAPNTILLENQISRDEVKQAAEIKVDETSTLKTRTFDTWIKENPTMSNKSFANFVANTGKTIDQLADKAVVEDLSGQKTDVIKTQVSTLVTKVEANIDAAINKAKEEGKKEEDIIATDLVFDVPELEKTDINKEDIADIGTEDLTKPEPAPQPTPSSFASREALEKATWRAADESVVKPLVTSSASKAAKVLYTYNGEKWETPTEAYFVEAVISPDLNLHYFAFGLVDSKYTGMGQISPFVEDNNTYFSYEIHLKENKTSSGYCSFETAEVDGITYLKGTDKEKDANDNKKVFYMASVAIPQGLVTAIEQMKNTTPTTSYVDELNQKLVENTTWKTSDERTIYKLLTTGREYAGQIYDDEIGDWVDVDPIADGGMAAEIIYSTKDGANWAAPTDKPIIIYEEMGGSHPYCLYKNNQWVGPNQQFHYKKAKNLFRYIQYSNNSVEEPVEEGLEYREVLFSGYYKIEEITSEGVTYYRATNTDNGAKDVYFFKLIKRPAVLGKGDPSDEVIQLDKLMNASWEDLTESEVQELIGYKNLRAAKIIYSYDGGSSTPQWVNPTEAYMVYFEPPASYHYWHFYVKGKHLDNPLPNVEVYENVWHISNLVVSETKTIKGAFKFQKARVDNQVYLKAVDTESNNVLDSIFMEITRIPSDVEADIDAMFAASH